MINSAADPVHTNMKGKIYMNKLQHWLIYNSYKYLTPISLILIFTLTYLYRNKSWKKCIRCFGVAFLIGTLCNHFFFVWVLQLKPGLTAGHDILLRDYLEKAVDWSFYTMLNFLLLRSVLGILHLCRAKKAVCIIVLLPVCYLYIMFYLLIEIYESYLFDPFLHPICNKIAEMLY